MRLDTIPVDVNTLRPATVHNTQTVKTVHVQSVAKAEIADIVAPSDVSTGQVMEFKIIGLLNENLINPVAHIILPDAFGYTLDPLPLDGQNSALWSIKIPDEYQTRQDSIRVYLSGMDKNTGQPVANSPTEAHRLNFYQKPKLALSYRILAPNSAIEDGLLSYGQQIEIVVNTQYSPLTGVLDYAPLQGGGSVTLDSAIVTRQGFTLADGETLTKPFNSVGDQIRWKLTAPKAEKTVSIKFSYQDLPLDQNSGLIVSLDEVNGTVSLPISVRSKKINLTMLDSLITEKTFQQGDKNMLLMAFKVSNNYSDGLYVGGLTLNFYRPREGKPKESDLIDRLLLNDLFHSIKIVNYKAYNSGLAKAAASVQPKIFAEYILDESSENPLRITFDTIDSLAAMEIDSLFVVAEIKDTAPNKSFMAVLQDVEMYDVDPSILLSAVDDNGQELATSDMFKTHPFTVIDQDPEKAFRNYPNPFGAQYEYTTIAFKLDHPSDVTIRIFTLVGELVWTKSLPGLNADMYDNLVRWDGKNDRGYTVLNGVYLCTIEIKPTDGGPAVHYITKIAYIK